ncbi:MAG: hydroxymethylbilane synthase [Bacteroidota bacterium]
MKQLFNIACRGSWLSLAQAEIFSQKILAHFPGITLNLVIETTAGDKEQNTPLHLVEGKDFFTREIQDCLQNGKADFAVHSMKDVSNEYFFQGNHYAIIDRDCLQDVVIFNEDITDKIKAGKKITIGTSSPRRSLMATGFLQKALPKGSENPVHIESQPIRGNVDTRLQKLNDQEYDGIILAAAGLNRLLRFSPSKEKVSQLLQNKKLMVLPLFECPPAAGQGAIVAEATADNTDAIEILERIKSEVFTNAILQERVYAQKYGYGCSQQFGVFHVDTENTSFTYTSGANENSQPFTEWDFEMPTDITAKELFSSTDYMKDFFSYQFLDEDASSLQGGTPLVDRGQNAVFISSHKAIHSTALVNKIAGKKVWAAGTRTWYELAKKGIWVEGCADGLGLEFLQSTWESPLVKLKRRDIQIITNTSSAHHWIADGWDAAATYELIPKHAEEIQAAINKAPFIFWTSFQQYEQYKTFINDDALHACPAGKTAKLLLAGGLKPFIFPTIKAFTDWRSQQPKV